MSPILFLYRVPFYSCGVPFYSCVESQKSYSISVLSPTLHRAPLHRNGTGPDLFRQNWVLCKSPILCLCRVPFLLRIEWGRTTTPFSSCVEPPPTTAARSTRASMLVYCSCACIYALHSALALRMPLCMSLCTFPAHASTRFTLHLPCACLYAVHCLLCACLTLSTFPAHASTHFVLHFPYVCLYASRCLLCARLYAFDCLLSARMHLRISLSTLRMPLFNFTVAHASMHLPQHLPYASLKFTVYFPCGCLYAFHCLLSLRIYALASALALRMALCSLYACHCLLSLPMHLCNSLYTCPYACLYACRYASHSVLARRMPLCSSLRTFSTHASTHFAVYFPTLQPELWGRTSRTTFVLNSYDFVAGAAKTYFAHYFCTATLQPDPCRRSRRPRRYAKIHTGLHRGPI